MNLTPCCVRVETLPERYDYVVSRAVTAMPEFVDWIWSKIERGQRGTLPNGILYLKGGDLAEAGPYRANTGISTISMRSSTRSSSRRKKVVYYRKK